jgi:hypothetical protein
MHLITGETTMISESLDRIIDSDDEDIFERFEALSQKMKQLEYLLVGIQEALTIKELINATDTQDDNYCCSTRA